MRMVCRLAREVSGVQLSEGAVEVLDVEADTRRSTVLFTDLDHAEHLGGDFTTIQLAVQGADTREREAVAARRDDCRCRVLVSDDFGDGSHICEVGISTALDTSVHHATAIVDANVVVRDRRYPVPVAGCEVFPEALVQLACRV